MKIDGEFLSNLRFADDIFLCTETPQELQQMLQELSDESRQMGLNPMLHGRRNTHIFFNQSISYAHIFTRTHASHYFLIMSVN